jgi:Lar family restriction alleviation protein
MTDRRCVYVWPEGHVLAGKICWAECAFEPGYDPHDPRHKENCRVEPFCCDYHFPAWEGEPERETAELLPCPFCGGSTISASPIWGQTTFVAVWCWDCGVKMEKAWTRDEAIAAWNTRTEVKG